jgi:glycosyltransferase involved in cell wall biosynthesis
VGGTNPSLLEAMGAGNAVIAHGNVFNREVSGETALFFEDAESLANHLDLLDEDSERVAELGSSALSRVRERYTWDGAVDSFIGVLSGRGIRDGSGKPLG